MTPYQHLTTEERAAISALRQSGMDLSAIARQLNRHRSTISREIRRNSCNDMRYRVDKASRKACARRHISPRNLQISRAQLIGIKRLIRAKWSPQQISERFERERSEAISHETIYQLIKEDQINGGNLWTFLRCSRKKRRKRYGSYDSRGRLAGKRMISERPEEILQRTTFGHWEGDTVMGTDKACFCTLVERKTRYTLIIELKTTPLEN
jgi:transposase, IS30 family